MHPVYKYLGDKMTRSELKDQYCMAVCRPNGKCIRGRNGSMLVDFGREIGINVVIGRRLRIVAPIVLPGDLLSEFYVKAP